VLSGLASLESGEDGLCVKSKHCQLNSGVT
jgi:hypothetical protein